MVLTDCSISRLMDGNVSGFPLELQILDIRRLNADVCGTFVARLKLSDGKNFYGGFVIDVSILESSQADVYAIIRIDKLMVLKHLQEKLVLQILQMEMVFQDDKCIGKPEAWFKVSDNVAASFPMDNIQYDTVESSAFEQPHSMTVVTSIAQLSTLTSTKTAVEGLITRKSEVRNFSNGKGKFFTFDIADLYSEIRCKAFNDIVDMFFEEIIIGKAYRLVNFILNHSNKQYNHLSHELEINLIKNTVLHQIPGDAFQDVSVSFNYVKISSISLTDTGKCVDLFGTIKTINDAHLIYVAKRNSYLHTRIITVADDTGTVDVVLWNDFAKNFSGTANQNISFKDLVIQHFKGKLQLATNMMSLVAVQNGS